jgi:hypothetical protein
VIHVAAFPNQRPRKTLAFGTPSDELRAVLRLPVEPNALTERSAQ